jgi:hypothetical protein
MKSVVRQRDTVSYLKDHGRWTEDFRLAQHFVDGWSALAACRKHNLFPVDFVQIKGAAPSNDDAVWPLFSRPAVPER